MGRIAEQDRAAYYRGALVCLRFIEQRKDTGRRFGKDADARWVSFRGELATADRIDLLIRDADAEWPCALGARSVFALRSVAEDEPFGADWEPLDSVDAEELWREVLAKSAPSTVGAALDAMAAAWEIPLSPIDVGAVGATDRLLIVGPSAVASAIAAFAEGSDLDWAEQVVCVGSAPGHRQLAAAGAALVNAAKPTRLVEPGSELEPAGYRLVVSDDACDEDRTWAENLSRARANQRRAPPTASPRRRPRGPAPVRGQGAREHPVVHRLRQTRRKNEPRTRRKNEPRFGGMAK